MLHIILILYLSPRRSSSTWTFHQARGWKAIRRRQGPIRLTTTSISPRTTWPRSTLWRLRPTRVRVRTAARREPTAPFSLFLTSRAKLLRDPDGKPSPWETAAVVPRLTERNLKERMRLVSIQTRRSCNMFSDEECHVRVISRVTQVTGIPAKAKIRTWSS